MSWKDNVRNVVPYTPGEQPKVCGTVIKLNTNEMPYPPAPGVREAVDALELEQLRLYPNTTAAPLAEALADYYGITKEEIFVGVGSDDVLANCFLTFFNGEKPILFPDITYSFYEVWANLYHIPFERPKVDENFRIRKEDYMKPNGGIVIANPNAPTAIGEPASFIEEIVKANPDSIVIVDEAYVDFGGESSMALTRKYDNLLVVQTFSKSRAFAGMRIGFAVGNPELIKYMNDVKFSINSYTMNQTAIYYGIKAVEDDEYFKATVKKVIDTRERSREELIKLGFNIDKSQTNFLFATHKEKPAKEIFEFLKTKNIYVRYFDAPRINNYLRISIGTDKEMDTLIATLKEYIK